MGEASADLLCEGPDSKYFRLWGPDGLCYNARLCCVVKAVTCVVAAVIATM